MDLRTSEDELDQMASEGELDPQHVAAAFVEQYYHFTRNLPEVVHKFYKDESIIDRLGPDGEMTSTTTTEGINDMIMSSDYKGGLFEPINVDAQGSLRGGCLVAVNGYFVGMDNLKRSFYQTFFLAKQTVGYFVLNDILRFQELESEILPNSCDTNENASDVPLIHEPDVPDIPAQPKEVKETGDKLSDVDCCKKALDNGNGNKLSDAKTAKNLSDIKTSKKTSDDGNSKTAAGIDSVKEKASASGGTMVEVLNSSVEGSENESTLPNVASDEKQDLKKTSYASMVAKESKVTSPTHNTGYRIVRVAADADQQHSVASVTQRDPVTVANSPKKENLSCNSAAENNNAPDVRSIYIANLPSEITKNGLIDALKIFGRVRPAGVQIKMFEDGFCFGFVEFESAASARKAVEVHYVNVGGKEAYMMYKKSGTRYGNSRGNGGSRNSNFKGQDTGEIHGNSGYQEGNQVDLQSQPRDSGERDGESNRRSQIRTGRAYSRGRPRSSEMLPDAEAYRKNGQRRDGRGKSGEANYQKNKQQQ